MAAFVWTPRGQSGGNDNVVELAVLIIFIYNLIVGNETAPVKL